MSDPILLDVVNNVALITINREQARNALTDSMSRTIFNAIRSWHDKAAIILQGKTNLSSGGDIKSVWEKGYMGPIHVYNAAFAAHTSAVPVISFMEGFTMGAALATSVFSKFRIATDDTVAAMPEVKVGMIPDVGGSYFLSRLKHNVGLYMGLSGSSLKGKDVSRSGLATHFVPKNKIDQLKRDLLTVRTTDEVEGVIERYSEADDIPPLADDLKDVEYCFGGKSVEDIMNRLIGLKTQWAVNTLKALKEACPGSLKITMRSLREGAKMDVWSCLKMDYTFVYWSLRNHDFKEGVRAVLVDKDHRPKWDPATLTDVTEAYVDSFFREIPQAYRLRLLTAPSKL